MTAFWRRFWHHDEVDNDAAKGALAVAEVPDQEQWVTVPEYIKVDPHQHVLATVIAASVLAADRTDTQLRLKHLYVPNPEAQLVSLIASCCATDIGDGKYVVKSIRKRVE